MFARKRRSTVTRKAGTLRWYLWFTSASNAICTGAATFIRALAAVNAAGLATVCPGGHALRRSRAAALLRNNNTMHSICFSSTFASTTAPHTLCCLFPPPVVSTIEGVHFLRQTIEITTRKLQTRGQRQKTTGAQRTTPHTPSRPPARPSQASLTNSTKNRYVTAPQSAPAASDPPQAARPPARARPPGARQTQTAGRTQTGICEQRCPRACVESHPSTP